MSRLDVDAVALGLIGISGGDAYRLAPAAGVRMFEHGDHRLMVREHDQRVEWALLEWTSGRLDSAGVMVDPQYDALAHGWGYSGNLREARHTYFGDDGYVFHIDPALIAWAFEQLREWFDFPGPPGRT